MSENLVNLARQAVQEADSRPFQALKTLRVAENVHWQVVLRARAQLVREMIGLLKRGQRTPYQAYLDLRAAKMLNEPGYYFECFQTSVADSIQSFVENNTKQGAIDKGIQDMADCFGLTKAQFKVANRKNVLVGYAPNRIITTDRFIKILRKYLKTELADGLKTDRQEKYVNLKH